MDKSLFTDNRIYSSLLKFAIPGVITILMSELYNMVDTFFVGKYTGSAAIGAMGVAFPIQRTIIALSLMIGVGTATAVSRAYGENNRQKILDNIGSSISLGLTLLSLFTIISLIFCEQILSLLGARNEILSLSKAYINIVVLGSLLLGFTNIFGYELTALGHPRITLIATGIGTLINIILDYILVAKFYMGVEGAAIATLFSQFVAFVFTIISMQYYKKKHGISLKPCIKLPYMYTILSVGFATFIIEISDAVLIAALNNILLPIGKDEAIVIVSAITRVSMFMYITIIGVGAGMQPLAAFSYGAKDYNRLKKIVKASSNLTMISSGLLWAFIMIFTHNIIGSFMKDPELLKKTVAIFRYTIIIFPVISLYYICIYYCQSIAKAKLSFWLSIYRQLLLFIPMLIVLSRLFGMKGVWTTYPLTDLIAAVTGIYFLRKNMTALNELNA